MRRDHVKTWLAIDGEIFLRKVGITGSMKILDLGAGSGHYTIPAAKIVGEAGHVYAMDKSAGSLEDIAGSARSMGLENITTIRFQEGNGIDIEDNTMDFVLTYDMLHYMEEDERKMLYAEIKRILRPADILSVYPKHIRHDEPLWHLSNLDLDDIIEEIEASGLVLDTRYYLTLIHDNYYNNGHILNFRKLVDFYIMHKGKGRHS